MKNKNKLILVLLAGFVGLQFFRPEKIDHGTKTQNLTNVPKEVNAILRSSCFDCHSSQANLRWYDKITPANFLVTSHIKEARKVLDFSQWNSWPKAQQNSTIYYALNKVLSGEMPLPSYAAVHSSAKLNQEQIQTLKNYALSLTPRKISDDSQIKEAEKQYNSWVKGELKSTHVKDAPNGQHYFPDYRNWKAISTTDRFDNGTMRIIFGNTIAVKAIQDHKVNPWPDGAVFAKTVWKQQVQKDGSISSGEFLAVEFMVKDAKKYSKTKGWNWARWKGADLKPYGGDTPNFEQECIECHKPVANRDYVFTSPLYLISQLKKIRQNEKL
ncbi:heme-binding domain-containing protein [Chryseobacterium capnotolerans]|uniref:heme-binding domain-containing protein n=1 Tax=Chryseobacterium TaxID=59732 RepID=UPI00083A5372|nr:MULTISPECIES: heme-binding domain-containing protein [Chryseobacterium]UHO37225.1 heme-binding domain-containing protein [Chryseobacterium capnotolerans]